DEVLPPGEDSVHAVGDDGDHEECRRRVPDEPELAVVEEQQPEEQRCEQDADDRDHVGEVAVAWWRLARTHEPPPQGFRCIHDQSLSVRFQASSSEGASTSGYPLVDSATGSAA